MAIDTPALKVNPSGGDLVCRAENDWYGRTLGRVPQYTNW